MGKLDKLNKVNAVSPVAFFDNEKKGDSENYVDHLINEPVKKIETEKENNEKLVQEEINVLNDVISEKEKTELEEKKLQQKQMNSIKEFDETIHEDKKEVENPPKKKKPGRPKIRKEEYRSLYIQIPVSLFEQAEDAIKLRRSINAYVEYCIREDLRRNEEKYKQLKNIL